MRMRIWRLSKIPPGLEIPSKVGGVAWFLKLTAGVAQLPD
jgi:hypothetical protein